LANFANSSAQPFVNGIRAAREKIVARTDETRTEFLRKRGFSRAETTKIIETVLNEEGHPPASIFDFVQGITAVARAKPHQDARLDMETKAKKLLGQVISHAAAVHGLEISVEPVNLARIALRSLGLVGKGNERDRRPTEEELNTLYKHFDANLRQIIPMSRIIKFAIASAMRQEEICRVTWDDLDQQKKLLQIRDRKDPRTKRATTSASRCRLYPATTHLV
jgi:integrase